MEGVEPSEMNATMMASHSSLLHLSSSEPSLKRLKLEGSLSQTSLSGSAEAVYSSPTPESPTPPAVEPEDSPLQEEDAKTSSSSLLPPASMDDSPGVVSPDEHGLQHHTESFSNPSLSDDIPLKATKFRHLSQKYLEELDYMLREFQRLERQLLGAKTMQTAESTGSKERREKLHSFIQHLDETIQQIRTGCQLEAAGKSTVTETTTTTTTTTGLAQPTKEKEEEENVQKLEEHILANLLPVKVRLKKQLAAQQGAKHNPAGMPVRGVVSDAASTSTSTTTSSKATTAGTFLAVAAQQQFGKPLDGGGSSLTQKLHGATLGSESRTHGTGVGTTAEDAKKAPKDKIFRAGMTIGSDQMESSLSAASSAHRVMIRDPALLDIGRKKRTRETAADAAAGILVEAGLEQPPTSSLLEQLSKPEAVASVGQQSSKQHVLSAEDRRKLRKKRRKKKRLLREQQQQAQLQQRAGNAARKKCVVGAGKKRGPRSVEYMCALCNELYNYTCEYNPWWALSQHECPKCRKTQVRKLFILVALLLFVASRQLTHGSIPFTKDPSRRH